MGSPSAAAERLLELAGRRRGAELGRESRDARPRPPRAQDRPCDAGGERGKRAGASPVDGHEPGIAEDPRAADSRSVAPRAASDAATRPAGTSTGASRPARRGLRPTIRQATTATATAPIAIDDDEAGDDERRAPGRARRARAAGSRCTGASSRRRGTDRARSRRRRRSRRPRGMRSPWRRVPCAESRPSGKASARCSASAAANGAGAAGDAPQQRRRVAERP